MQPKTVSLRTFIVVVGILAVTLVIGLAGIWRIEITPATVDATTPQYRPQTYTYITQEEGPDHPDQELLSRIYERATQSVVSIQVRHYQSQVPPNRLRDSGDRGAVGFGMKKGIS